MTGLRLVVETDGETGQHHADQPSRRAATLVPGDPVMIRVDPAHVSAFAPES